MPRTMRRPTSSEVVGMSDALRAEMERAEAESKAEQHRKVRSVKDGLAALKTSRNLTEGQKEQLQTYIDRLDEVAQG